MNISQLMSSQVNSLDADLARDARFLLADILKKTTTFFVTNSDFEPSPKQLERFENGLNQLKNGTPLAYVLGSQPFWLLDFAVNEHTLIPRADTQVLVERALKVGDVLEGSCGKNLSVLDLGTGSGIIAICLKHERAHWRLTATDFSFEALKVARQNAAHNQTDVRFLQGSWFEPTNQAEKFHLIASNPPYIADDDAHLAELTFEPNSALVAADNGLADIAHIAQHAPMHLHDAGWLLVEHGYTQGAAVRNIFTKNGFADVATIKDYGGNERVTLGCWCG